MFVFSNRRNDHDQWYLSAWTNHAYFRSYYRALIDFFLLCLNSSTDWVWWKTRIGVFALSSENQEILFLWKENEWRTDLFTHHLVINCSYQNFEKKWRNEEKHPKSVIPLIQDSVSSNTTEIGWWAYSHATEMRNDALTGLDWHDQIRIDNKCSYFFWIEV